MLSSVDNSRVVEDEKNYRSELSRSQRALSLLANQIYLQQRPVVVVFEGGVAIGRGQVIQCLTEGLDPRSYMVHAIAEPTGDAVNHHFLWRFWQRLPNQDQMAIFDRSWYLHSLELPPTGPLAKRGLASVYMAINDFERQLVDFGILLFKFWMHVSPGERKRSDDQHNAASSDTENQPERGWPALEELSVTENAFVQMLKETNSVYAPWTIVEADDWRFAQLRVLDTLVRGLSEALKFDDFERQMPDRDQADSKSSQKKNKKKKKKKK